MRFAVHSKSGDNLNYRTVAEIDSKGIVREVEHFFAKDYVGFPFNFLLQHMVDVFGTVTVYSPGKRLLNVPTEG